MSCVNIYKDQSYLIFFYFCPAGEAVMMKPCSLWRSLWFLFPGGVWGHPWWRVRGRHRHRRCLRHQREVQAGEAPRNRLVLIELENLISKRPENSVTELKDPFNNKGVVSCVDCNNTVLLAVYVERPHV